MCLLQNEMCVGEEQCTGCVAPLAAAFRSAQQELERCNTTEGYRTHSARR
jgi:hypothetical protein